MKKYVPFIFLICMIGCDKHKNYEVALVHKMESKLGEGAIWNYKTNELYWVDIEDKKLHLYNTEQSTNTTIEMPCRIGTVVPCNAMEKAVVALEDGVYVVDTKTSALHLLSDVEADIAENRFNDGKCDPNGNLWVGSMHLQQLKSRASLYKVSPSGKTEKMLSDITISNGIVWTKDGKTMYYIDTPTKEIKAYDFDLKANTISNARVVVTVDEKDGFPDGMTIDENDMLWVGMWNGNAVAQFDPNTGALVQKIPVPAHNVTSCAFGGDHLDELYITTASVDMTDEERAKYPLAGSLFKVKLDVKGVKSTFF